MLPLPQAEAIRVPSRASGEDLATSLEIKSQLAYQVKMKLDDQQPTAAVDLDGTLTIPHPHWPKVDIDEVEARPGAAEGMQQLQAAGWRLIIFTMHDDLDGVADWLDTNDIPFHYINDNPDQDSDSPKVQAHVYIDDRALNADKPWPKIVQEVLVSEDAPEPKSKHLIITGYSGAGKSTLAKVLGERLSLPVWKVDNDELWKANKELADHPDRYNLASKEGKRFRKLLKKLVRRAVASEEPSILEGCQFLAATGTLRGHQVILCDGDQDTVAAQRLKRDAADGKLTRDGIDKRMQKAFDLYKKLKPDIERLKKRDGVKAITSPEMESWARKYVFEHTVYALTQTGEDIEIAKAHAEELANFHLENKKDGDNTTTVPSKAALAKHNPTQPSSTELSLAQLNSNHSTKPAATVQQNLEEKALSAMSETSGGALVAPPQQGGFHARRKCLKCGRYLIQSKMGWGCPDPSCNWSLFAASAETVKAFRYRRKGWFTIGGHPCETGEHCEGQRIYIDGSGNITKGPKALKNKNISKFKDSRKQKPPPQPPPVKPSPPQGKNPQPESKPESKPQPLPPQTKPESTPKKQHKLQPYIDEIIKRYGYPPDKVLIQDEPGYEFTVGDRKCQAAGNCNLGTGEIKLFPSSLESDDALRRVLSHEIMHGQYQQVYQTPTVADFRQNHFAKLVEEDGVTDYSKAYWQAYQRYETTFHIAIHETLAEIQSYMELNGRIQMGTTWRQYYRTVRKEIKAAKTGSKALPPEQDDEPEFKESVLFFNADWKQVPADSPRAAYCRIWHADGSTEIAVVTK